MNGNLQVETLPGGRRRFTRVSDGLHLLTESSLAFWAPLLSHSLHQLNATFEVGSAELYGLGQHRQACYPTGGAQTPPLLRTFTPGSLVHLDLARGEGGAANTLPWLSSASADAGGATGGAGGDDAAVVPGRGGGRTASSAAGATLPPSYQPRWGPMARFCQRVPRDYRGHGHGCDTGWMRVSPPVSYTHLTLPTICSV